MFTLKTFNNISWFNMKDVFVEHQMAGTLNKTYDVIYYMNMLYKTLLQRELNLKRGRNYRVKPVELSSRDEAMKQEAIGSLA